MSDDSTSLPRNGEIEGRAIVCREALPLRELGCLPMPPPTRMWRALLLESGREVLVAASCDSWLFFWMVDVDSGAVSCRASLPAPDWPTFTYDMNVKGDTLWVFNRDAVLEIDRRDWKILSWRPLAELLPDDDLGPGHQRLIEGTSMLPGSPYLWVKQSTPYGAYVIDLRTWSRVHPLLEVGSWTMPVLGSEEPVYLCPEVEEGPRLYRSDGTAVPGSEAVDPHRTLSYAAAPIGDGLLTLELDELSIGGGDVDRMTLSHVVPARSGSWRTAATFERRVLEGSWDRALNRLAVCRDQKLCFALVAPWRSRDSKHLLAVSVSGRVLRLRYRVRMPHDTVLLQHPKAPRVVAVFTDGQGLRVLPLERRKPALEPLPEEVYDRGWLSPPTIELEPYSCIEPLAKDGRSASLSLRDTIRGMSKRQRRAFLRHYEATLGDDVDEMINLYFALAPLSSGSEARREEQLQVLRLLLQRFAEHPAVALLGAEREALAGRLEEARRFLEVAAASRLEAFHRHHLRHLQGMMLLHEGRTDEAFAELDRIPPWRRRQRSCFVGGLPELTRPMADPPAAGEWSPDQPMLRQHVGAIRTANRALEAGDSEAAYRALDRTVFWQIGEIQIVARRAAAVLEQPAESAAERFQKRYVLAHFRENLNHRLRAKNVQLPGVTWDNERIQRIDERAREWLRGDQQT